MAFPEKRPEDSGRAVDLLIELVGSLEGPGGILSHTQCTY